ncbi:MAG: capsid protein [Cressdnaviricota sp.]|nr:MAG: capsid protein [Cressdnaviricota sp.]
MARTLNRSNMGRGSRRRSTTARRPASYKRRNTGMARTGRGLQKSFVTSFVGPTLALVSGVNQFPVLTVAESQLVQASAFAQIYDEFTITKFEVKFIPQYNVAGASDVIDVSVGGSVQPIANGIARMHSEVNKSVNCQAATQENDILACNDARTDRLNDIVVLKCLKPTPWLFSGATGGGPTAVAARTSGVTWLDVSSGSGIQWGGIRTAMIPPGLGVGALATTQYFHVVYKVWVTYREQI